MSDQIQSHIEELGTKTPEEIATLFRGLGITGYRVSAEMCPTAQYLRKQVGNGVKCIRVASNQIEICETTCSHITIFPMPPSLRQFIRDFDNSEFPDLIVYDPEGGKI